LVCDQTSVDPGPTNFVGWLSLANKSRYVWNTQSDMALALLGAILSLVALSKIHDKQLMKLSVTH
jgi:hypothetical protein